MRNEPDEVVPMKEKLAPILKLEAAHPAREALNLAVVGLAKPSGRPSPDPDTPSQ
ncbi:hypothetical protein PtA15_6A543 [Puccinia triticina]|uniref:Uncharacterized protein n=1 Tax=Puccinia triticina TaxID=208348 RepID=A0ABY7CMM2_9BASI|nr:uncharacterized protein PtA15_6A543 [Puccinia triticina]WAQ85914.1 hypothetical protein PtA15_6A543 [Puccinia triticina]WAR55808.1 hypothetical protein PtB15_6B551 [Puccinia triticina]